jgi:hypothetical protein
LAAAGIPVPRHAPVDSAAGWHTALASVRLPAVVKPVRGEGSRSTFPIVDDTDVRQLPALLFDGTAAPVATPGFEGYTVEQILQGRESHPFGDYVSVDCRTVDGVTTLYGITGTLPLAEPFRETGKFWPCQLSAAEQAELIDLTRTALQALGVRNSVTHTEIKLADSGPRIIEVNGRLGGFIADLAQRHCAVDMVREAAEIALGCADALSPCPHPGRAGVTYSYFNLPPAQAQVLVGVAGRRALRSATGFEGYQRIRSNDSRLAADGSTDILNVVYGHADSHGEMMRRLRAQLAELVFTFRSDVGSDIGARYDVSALDLPGAEFLTSGVG